MYNSILVRGCFTALLIAGLAACGGTSTDTQGLLNNEASVTDDTNTDPGTNNNQAPTARIEATPTSGTGPLLISANAMQSTDDGSIVSYSWNFGDGTSSQVGIASHTYASAGNYTLTLTVTDNDGASDSASTTISVSNPTGENLAPTARISATPNSGVAALLVNVDGRQSTDDIGVVSYNWNFGDGNTSQNAVTSHTYSQPGTYNLRLTVTDGNGLTSTASTTIHVFDSLDNSQVIVPAGVSFYDTFEYNVDRNNSSDPTGVNNLFTSQGGWSRVKSENTTGSHNGYLYTVNQIPGYSGSFPGRNSSSVLAIEARPGSMGSQTDFYLQFGEENAPLNTVPGNVWFQFWIYSNRYGDQMSAYDGRFKFLYPCNGPYPCQSGQINWLNCMGFTTGEPYWANEDPTEAFITNIDPYNTTVDYQVAPDWNQYKLGQTDVSENITPNRWTLVKIHYDTSTTSGTFEAWMKPLGGQWVKVAEWIDGQTPDFAWTIPAGDVGGHRVFRMPTTMDGPDSWMYLDDFAMATSEADLPIYPY